MINRLKECSIAISFLIAIVSLCFIFGVIPFNTTIFVNFIWCSLILIFGQVLFLTGADNSILIVGKHLGTAFMKLKKIWLILLFGAIFGLVATLAEPDVQVLASFIGANSGMKILFAFVTGLGVGLFTLLAFVRILKGIPLKYMLLFAYILIVILALLIPEDLFAISFDASGMTTGVVTTPFLLSLTIGICSIRASNKKEDNFGVVAIASAGSIIAVEIMSLFLSPGSLSIKIENNSNFFIVLLQCLAEVSLAIAPLLIIFIAMQIFIFKFPKKYVTKILLGFLMSSLGLILFLSAVVFGLSPMGEFLGKEINSRIILIILSLAFGLLLVFTEPAVKILLQQIEEVSSGLVKRKYILLSISFAVAIALLLSMLKVFFDFSIWWYLAPLIFLAIILTFFTPPIFYAIAFDSGTIVTGTILVSFILPFFVGVSNTQYASSLNALGLIGITTLFPIIAIEILGIIYHIMEKRHLHRTSSGEFKYYDQTEIKELGYTVEEENFKSKEENN